MKPATTILITGASRGIGAHIARALAEPGRKLLIAARSRSHLYGTARACTERGADVTTFEVSLEDADSIAQLLSEVAPFEVDMLVNNAGISGQEALPWEGNPELWWQTQLVNVRAPYLLQRGLVPGMLARGGGRIVDLSSGAAVRDDALASDYYVSKTALMRLGSSMHDAGASQGLRVFEVAPGVVQTDMTAAMKAHEGREEWNPPSQVAELIAAISRGELDGISGTQVRAGTDTVEELRKISARGVGPDEKRLRLTPWEDPA